MFTIGCDPEVFVANKSSGEICSAINTIGGTKEAPMPVKLGAVQEDNVLAEFNIVPAKNAIDFAGNIIAVMRELKQLLKSKNLEPRIIASHVFDPKVLEDPRAWIFGCDPDFNAWASGLENHRPNAVNKFLRTAGGHIHAGWKHITEEQQLNVIRWMDLFIGVPSIILDGDLLRRELYGKAGAFRPKPYGVEYRVVSNFWISKPAYIRWVFTQTEKAVSLRDNMDVLHDAELIIRAINNNDRAAAGVLMAKHDMSISRDIFKAKK